MDASPAEADMGTDPDFTTKPFTTHREPIQDLIRSFSSLYLEPEGKAAVQEEDGNLN